MNNKQLQLLIFLIIKVKIIIKYIDIYKKL